MTKTQYLTDHPTTANQTDCIAQSGYLAAGLYLPESGIAPGRYTNGYYFNVQHAGVYSWWSCIVPQNGSYVFTQHLQNSSGMIMAWATHTFALDYPADYTWAAFLHHIS